MKQTLCTVLPAAPTVGDVVFRDDGTFHCCYADGIWTEVGGAAPRIYSLTEQVTNGIWVNNDPIYRKVVDIGGLPATSGDHSYAHSIVGLRLMVDMWGIATNTATGVVRQIGDPNNVLTEVVRLTVDQTNIYINVSVDQSVFDETYIILEYTRDP